MKKVLPKAILSFLWILMLVTHSAQTNAQPFFSQQGNKLVGTGYVVGATSTSVNQGSSIAISADGNTAIVGARRDNNDKGAAWIYTRVGGLWAQQGNKLVGTGGGTVDGQGTTVAISGDGNTAIVGGLGGVWVYTRSGGVWTQQGGNIQPSTASGSFGTSVSLSSDGNTAIVGASGDNQSTGAAWIFTRSGGVWTQQGNKLVGTGGIPAVRFGKNIYQGYSVSISGDGNTAILGAPGDNINTGALWVFTRTGGVWSQQGNKLVGTGGAPNNGSVIGQGFSVSLSTDGNTAIVASPGDNSSNGAAWIFTRSAGVWSQQGNKLVAAGATITSGITPALGWSVAISGDGNTVLAGGKNDNLVTGATWVFNRIGGVWTQSGDKLIGNGASGPASQGSSVAISSDGRTAIVGGTNDNNNLGAAWPFVLPNLATALNFDGVDDYVTLNNTIGNFGTGDFTIEMRIKTSVSATQYLLSKRGFCGGDNMLSMQIYNGVLSMETASDGGADYAGLTGSIPINDGNWHHIAAVRKAGILRFYIDGVADGSVASNANINSSYTTTLGVSVCTGQNPSVMFQGSMDELSFWNRALCQGEIQNNMSCSPANTGQTGLQALYHFDNGSIDQDNSAIAGITTLTDATGNGNNGSLMNFTFTGSVSNYVAGNTSGTCTAYSANPVLSGAAGICAGLTTTLSSSISGGVWTSSDLSIASINASTGVVTAIAAGAVTITYTTDCGAVATQLFTVTPNNTITLSSAAGTDTQTKCINTAIANITYATTGATGASFSGLPAGVTGSWSGNVVTINGTPSVQGSFNYTITLTGGCGTVTTGGSITVTPLVTPTFTQVIQTCGVPLSPLPTTSNNGITGTWSPGLNNSATTTYTFTPNGNQCAATATMTIVINSLPASPVVTGNNSLLCSGASAVLTASSSAGSPVYNWYTVSTGGAPVFTGAVFTTPALAANTTYYVDVTDGGTCTSARTAVTVKVFVINDQNVTASPSAFCVSGSGTVTVASTQAGFNYTLRNNANNAIVAGPIVGTGSAINFNTGTINTTTTYNVLADNNHLGALGFSNAGNVTNNSFALNVSSGFTVEGWLFMNSLSGINGFASQGKSLVAGPFDIYVNSGLLSFWVGNGSTSQQLTTTLSSANTWYHIACVYDAAAAKQFIYINGVLANSASVTAPVANFAGAKLFLAGRADNGYSLNGKLDDIRIWNTARTASQISSNLNTCISSPQTGLFAYYQLDDVTTSTIAKDISGNGFDGTLNITSGSPFWAGGNLNCTPNCSLQMIATPTITVNQNPVATIAATGGTSTCPGNTITLNANSGSGYTYQWKKNGADISGATNASFDAGSTGSYSVVITNNGCASAASNAIVVTVADVIAPTISCPANQVLNLDANCSATLPDYRSLLTVSDNCTASNALAITQSPAPGTAVNSKGAIIITFTVTDASNNSSNCTITVDKKDVTAPVINCPTPISVNSTTNTCGAVVTFAMPTATDNCSGSAFNFFNSGEPNQAGSEDFLQFYNNGTWNDLNGSIGLNFIVEFNSVINTIFPSYNRIGTFGGHTYYQSTFTQSWQNARNAAIAIGGDLASINTLAEDQFLAPYGGSTWVGGYQDHSDPSYVEPGNASQNFGGWKWVDGTQLGAGQITITQIGGLPSGSTFPVGITTNTFKATDESGNSSTCSFTVTVKDIQPPVINNCPSDQTGNATSPSGAVVNYVTPVGTDNCSGATTVMTEGLASGSTFPIGTTKVTYEVTDAAGLTASCSFNVNVTGLAPVIKVPSNITVNNDNGKCGAIVSYAATETTAIPASTITYSIAPGSFFPVGTTNVVATATNAVGTSVATFSVTVTDNTIPVITTNGDMLVNNDETKCGATVTVSATAADNCGVGTPAGVRSDGLSLTDLYPVGTTTITWNVTDIHNNNAIPVIQTIVVTDNELPVITTNGNKSVNNDAGQCGAAVVVSATAMDNCGVGAPTGVRSDGLSLTDLYPVGTTTITWNVTDEHNNNAIPVIQTIVVTDNELPVITSSGNRSVNNDAGQCGAAVVVSATAADNCGVGAPTGVRSDGLSLTDLYPVGTTTITWNVTDEHNNNAIPVIQTIVVTDNELPVITSSGNRSVNNDAGQCGAAVTVSATAADNCTVGAPTGVRSDGLSLTDLYPVGTTTITWSVTDIHNNNAIPVIQTIVVTDNELPVITSNGNKSVNSDAGKCGAAVVVSATAADNCGVGTPAGVRSDGLSLTDLYPVGTTTITWNVTDIHNSNAIPVIQTIVVTDNELPVITTNGNKSVNNDAGQCGAAVVVSATAMDNCGVGTPTGLRSDGLSLTDLYPVGATTITWNVTDIHNNNAIPVIQTIVVTDNELPVITSNGDKSVNNDATKCGASVSVSATATDNCGVGAPTGVRSDGLALTDLYPVGSTTIIWTVTDTHGNSAIPVTQTVVVTDNEAPVIKCPSDTVFCANYGGITNYTIKPLIAGDNCGISSTGYAISGATTRSGMGTNASGTFAVGVSTIIWTVKDTHGNTSVCSTKVTINPLPVATYVSTNADAFCNKTTVTASSSINAASYSWTTGNTPGSFVSSPDLVLGLTNNDGNYNVFVKVNATGCVSEFPVAYNFQKQNLSSSYTILAYKEVELGKYNKVQTGSVGVMTAKGEAEFNAYSAVNGPGAFVKAPKIDKDGSGILIPTQIIGLANVTLPTMQYNTANTNTLPNYTATVNGATIAGNYKNFTVKKGMSVTVTGNIFSSIRLEEGASIKFTAPVLNIDNLSADRGSKNINYSYIRFTSASTAVRVSGYVSIGSQVLVNPEANKVTFYMGDLRNDEEKFTVKGADIKVIANVIMPDGKIRVTSTDSDRDDYDSCDHKAHDARSCPHRGHDHNDCDHKAHSVASCNDDVYMTGLFIAEEVESKGNTVFWNSYDCSAPVPVYTTTAANQVTAAKVESKEVAVTTEEELKVTVMPNPSTTFFTLKLESKYATPVNMRVMDGAGRVIDAKSSIGSNSTIQIGHKYSSGTYYAELTQGTQRKVVQLIKAKG